MKPKDSSLPRIWRKQNDFNLIWEAYVTEGTKGTEQEREDADADNDGKLSSKEKEAANKDRDDKEHLCAKEVKHESFGVGQCIPKRHAGPVDGNVDWYAVMFEHGTEVVDTTDLEVITSEGHHH